MAVVLGYKRSRPALSAAPLTRSLEVPSLLSPSRGSRSAESLWENWVACFRRRCWCSAALSRSASSPFFVWLMASRDDDPPQNKPAVVASLPTLFLPFLLLPLHPPLSLCVRSSVSYRPVLDAPPIPPLSVTHSMLSPPHVLHMKDCMQSTKGHGAFQLAARHTGPIVSEDRRAARRVLRRGHAGLPRR
ncbi:hypothetical protein EYF80_051492 [Liparis tanakae]|uniref:Uncharacterized protein n=1 Tax=Liparis tanakae TaxID=230148 RepID=A0A4Z2FBN6_9TELE|nr:hypothetical protein EYF80_051492 [Liparis tanakae]